jgi:hypothetical protein
MYTARKHVMPSRQRCTIGARLLRALLLATLVATLAPNIASAQLSRVWTFRSTGDKPSWTNGVIGGDAWRVEFAESTPGSSLTCVAPFAECVAVTATFFGNRVGDDPFQSLLGPAFLTTIQIGEVFLYLAYTTHPSDPSFVSGSYFFISDDDYLTRVLLADASSSVPSALLGMQLTLPRDPDADPDAQSVAQESPGEFLLTGGGAAAVPEPGAALLLASGVLMLGAAARRRRHVA